MKQTVHLGYEVGSGTPVAIPLRHLCVTGQTQLSGKTTALEALIVRAGRTAIAFRTKRGERSFRSTLTIPPYFRERADWQFVASLLEATLHEKLKFERSWIMRACKGTATLADVQRNVRKALETAKGIHESVFTTLDHYLDIVVPQLASLPRAARLVLRPGLNVMELAEYSLEVQSLVIRSAMEHVYERENEVTVTVPEAWEFAPQKRGNPVKQAAIALARKGATNGNLLWLDSQDVAGVDTEVRRQVTVWLFGVQREGNEIKRVLGHLDLPRQPKPRDLMQLEIGQFYVAFDKELLKVYVQPAWMAEREALRIACGDESVAEAAGNYARRHSKPAQEDDSVYREKYEEEKQRADRLEREVAALKSEMAALRKKDTLPVPAVTRQSNRRAEHVTGTPAREARAGDPATSPPAGNGDARARLVVGEARALGLAPGSPEMAEATVQDLVDVVIAELDRRGKLPPIANVAGERPEINVTLERPVIAMDTRKLRGRLAQMIAEGFFEAPANGNKAFTELQRVAFRTAKPNVYRELDVLAEMGFLTKEPDGYLAVAGMKVRILEAQA